MNIMVNLILWCLMIISLLSFFGFVVKKVGVLNSLSDSYYELPNKMMWMFPFFMILFGSLMGTIAYHWLMFIAMTGFFMVGIGCNFKKDKKTKIIHFFGVFLGILFSQLYILFALNQPWITWTSITACLAINYLGLGNKAVWWQEFVAFLSVIVGLGILIF